MKILTTQDNPPKFNNPTIINRTEVQTSQLVCLLQKSKKTAAVVRDNYVKESLKFKVNQVNKTMSRKRHEAIGLHISIATLKTVWYSPSNEIPLRLSYIALNICPVVCHNDNWNVIYYRFFTKSQLIDVVICLYFWDKLRNC